MITIRRTEVRLFSDKQVALVEAFADQAVIAIENSRLFEAEQASKRELTEALEQQTATAAKHLKDHGIIRIAQARCGLDQRIEHFLHVEG